MPPDGEEQVKFCDACRDKDSASQKRSMLQLLHNFCHKKEVSHRTVSAAVPHSPPTRQGTSCRQEKQQHPKRCAAANASQLPAWLSGAGPAMALQIRCRE